MSAAYLLPYPTAGIDPTSLPIGPREAFVLSQVDGLATIAELSLGTGLDEELVSEILVRLEALGAIRFGEAAPERPSGISSLGNTSASSTRMRTVSEKPTSVERNASETVPPDREAHLTREQKQRPRFDEALLDEPADLPRATKEEILELHGNLDRYSHYELLGVSDDADRKTIKSAYFERVSVFHADRFFGKDLGNYKARIERIFGALTKAHDTLTRAQLRSDYDRYLRSRRATHGVRDSLPPSGVPVSPSGAAAAGSRDSLVQPVIPRAPRSPSIFSDALLPFELESTLDGDSSLPPLDLEPSSEPPAEPRPGPQSGLRAPDPAAARRLLAKKFGHRQAPSSSSSTSTSGLLSVDKEQVKKVVSEQMRARYEARHGGENSQIQRYVEMAEEARGKREWGSALNSLRIALSLVPEDARIGDLLEEIQEEADRSMADRFIEQAKYEEADGHMDRAARSYERAARGKSSGSHVERASPLYERAAFCLLAARGDRRKMVELARLAVTLDPKRSSARIVLAQAYELSNMRTSALGELSRALELDPKNEEAKQLQKQLK